MATYALTQQPYSIENIGYADQTGAGGPNYQQPSLYSFLGSSVPVFFGNAASITVNLFNGQWYINMFDTNGSFITFFIVDRLDYSDADHLVFSDGNFEYVIYDGPINYASPVSIPDDSSIPGDYQPGLANSAPTDIALSNANVAENSANGTIVGAMSDTDPDAGDTATFTLIDDAGGRFAISGSDLVVANGALLDFESNTSHSVTVRVTDSGGLTYDEIFAIGVTNANETPTDIALSSASVVENSANGTIVGGLSDTDPDASDTATFTLTDDAGGRFAISGSDLVVANGALLDFESNASHSVTVRVTDSGGLTFDKILAIGVTNANETPTDIALTNASVAENSVNGTVIGALSDADPDAGDTAAFTLTDDAGGRFAISGSNLVVANGALLDFESNTSHSVTVRVTDGGGLTFDKMFAIGVTNANETPTDIALSNANVAENSANGTAIGTLSDTDPDAGDTAAFTLVDNAGGRFAISGSNLVVANGALLDLENSSSHQVTVRVTDDGGLTFDKIFAIGVTNANETPTDISLSSASIAENTANGTVVGALSGTDPDASETATFSLTDNAGGRFAVSGSNLVVANGALLNFESNTSHSVTVRVTDSGGSTFDKIFAIGVTNSNEAPTNIALSNASVAENSSNGTVVGTLSDTDPDAGDTAAFTLVDDAGGRFGISGSNLVVADGSLLDFEHNSSHQVSVRVTDSGGLTFDKVFDIALTNLGEGSAPHWTKSLFTPSHPAGWSPAQIGDFNSDGTSDLAWYNASTGNVDIWKFQNGQWSASADVGSHPAGYQLVGAGDLNHDGTSDLLWFNPTTGHVDLWKISDGHWAGSVDVGTHPAGWQPSGVGDFNGDGTDDVAWYNPATGGIDIWKIANGQWAGSVDVGTHPAGYQPAATGDFNGDGTSDIVWYNPTTGDVDIWKIVDGHWAGSVGVGPHPTGWQPLGAADFNTDGTSDIAWYNPATNKIDIWLMNSGQWSASVDVGAHPAGAVAVGVGDFDHNGVSDIMWRDTATGFIDNWMLAYS